MHRACLGVFITMVFLTGTYAEAATYALDKAHTSITFKIRHLFSKVQGTFNAFEGTIEYDPKNPAGWKTSATIQAASIDTANANRDKHLRSGDFFDVEQFPTLTFESTGVRDATEEGGKLEGLLTIHGVQKPVVLDLEIHGVGDDPWGNTRAGFTATTMINRTDFGLTWNETLESGKLLVGEEIKITLEVEGVLQE